MDKYYKGKLSVKNLFADALFSLANGNEDDVILAAKYFVYQLLEEIKVEKGIFGADMEVSITNIGPTTIWLERE